MPYILGVCTVCVVLCTASKLKYNKSCNFFIFPLKNVIRNYWTSLLAQWLEQHINVEVVGSNPMKTNSFLWFFPWNNTYFKTYLHNKGIKRSLYFKLKVNILKYVLFFSVYLLLLLLLTFNIFRAVKKKFITWRK